MVLAHILAAVIIVSLISLVGVVALAINKKLLKKVLFFFVSFATGSLLAAAFLDLLPEAFAYGNGNQSIFLFPLLGIITFFIIEKFIYWHHHHTEEEAHAYTYLNLIGDGIHNFIDGIVIAASFLHSVPLGIATTLAIIFHEIPQEIGDFSILIHGGFSRMKALAFNFLSALLAVAGALMGFFFLTASEKFLPFLLAFTAGHFIYIAGSDLIPELREHVHFRSSVMQLIAIVLGIAAIWSVIMFFEV